MVNGQIDLDLVVQLIASQFPRWAHLPVSPVKNSGWDNRTFHLGDEMTVRLPSAEHYAGAVEKEQMWLPRLAPQLPLAIPQPLEKGKPDDSYPWPWSIYRWLEGEIANRDQINDLDRFARDLAAFLSAFQQIDTRGGPTRKLRGGSLLLYDDQARTAMKLLEGQIDTTAAAEIWALATSVPISAKPVWYHGDVAAGNLLVKEGELSAVIDFGGIGVGDPACDMSIAWTFLEPHSRRAFRDALGVDDEIWNRGRGWALWKAMIILAGMIETNQLEAASAEYAIDQLMQDYLLATSSC